MICMMQVLPRAQTASTRIEMMELMAMGWKTLHSSSGWCKTTNEWVNSLDMIDSLVEAFGEMEMVVMVMVMLVSTLHRLPRS